MTIFKAIKATSWHFDKYQGAKELERLKPIILEHLLYLPTARQLNDPADCRPRIKSMSVEENGDVSQGRLHIRRNPVLTLDLLQQHESGLRTAIQTRSCCTTWDKSLKWLWLNL
jgi:hypothetical protein